jgi:HK97 family phage major capsid protein
MGNVSLSPKNVGALVEVSHQMAQQGDPSAEQMVLRDLAQSVALAMDVGALSGDGTGGAPTGITNTGSIGAFTGTALDYAAVLDAQADLVKANAMQLGSLAYVCDPDTTIKLMQRVKFTSTASPIWEGNILEGVIQGIPARTSNQMAADSMLLGAWSSLIIAEWGTLELAVDDKFNFATGSIGLRAWYTVDVGVRYPAAFSLATTIT